MVQEVTPLDQFNFPPYPHQAESYKKWIKEYHALGIKFVYYQYPSTEVSTDEYHDYWGDWIITMPPSTYPRRGGWRGTAWTPCCFNSSWSDYYCHVADVMTGEYGADGIYFDGIMQERICQRPEAHGPECDRTWPLFVSREHIKKLQYVVQRNRGREAFLWGHSSDMKLAPFSGLMDLLYEGENYGGVIKYEDITMSAIRAQFGRQHGPLSVFCPQLTTKEMIPPTRLIGLLLLHGVEPVPRAMPQETLDNVIYPMFEVLDEYTDTTATFVPYYKQNAFTDLEGKPISAYVSHDGARVLLVLANQSDRPRGVTYQITFHPELHDGPQTIVSATDRLGDEDIRLDRNYINHVVETWNMRLIELKLE
jgi:hypothetical protein